MQEIALTEISAVNFNFECNQHINSIHPTTLCLCPLKTSENLKFFLCFQGDWHEREHWREMG